MNGFLGRLAPVNRPSTHQHPLEGERIAFFETKALDSRNGFSTDGHDRPLVFLRSLSQGQLRRCPSSRDNTLLSFPQSDHDLRGDSATEYQQSCSKLAKSGSIILTTHNFRSTTKTQTGEVA